MAESTLSIQFSDLQAEVGDYLGYRTDTSLWSSAETAEVTRVIKSGLRRFYAGGLAGHRWSFLYPLLTLNVISGKGDYDLPDDCGGLWGPLTVKNDTAAYWEVPIVPEGDVRSLRAKHTSSSGQPQQAAIRPKAMLDGAGIGQRLELVLFPGDPGGSYTMQCRYFILANALTSTITYPYGGAVHAETIRQACLAAAEVEREDAEGAHSKLFNEYLNASIARDKMLIGPAQLGYNADRSDETHDDNWRWRTPNLITYNGAAVPGIGE